MVVPEHSTPSLARCPAGGNQSPFIWKLNSLGFSHSIDFLAVGSGAVVPCCQLFAHMEKSTQAKRAQQPVCRIESAGIHYPLCAGTCALPFLEKGIGIGHQSTGVLAQDDPLEALKAVAATWSVCRSGLSSSGR